MSSTRCACILTSLTVTVPDPDCRVQAHSPQWQQHETRINEDAVFAAAQIAAWGARVGTEEEK